MAVVTVRVPGNDELTHEVDTTGYEQENGSGRVYVEGRRVDNGLFEMVPAEWIVRGDAAE